MVDTFAPTPISLGQWNRTLLHRQHLLTRIDDDAIEVIDRCVGLQSQDPRAAHYGLASRIVDYRPAELDGLLDSAEVVRMASLRSTVFLSDAEDARWIRALAQPRLDYEVETAHRRRLTAADPTDIAAQAAEELAGQELSVRELGARLQKRWPDEPASTLSAVARCLLPLVQVPPRGLWACGGGGPLRYQLFDDWVGPGDPAITGEEAVRDLIRLYLRGFGPATVKGVQTWAAMTGLKPHLEAMLADWELIAYVGPNGERLYDLDGLEIVDADRPAPARLVAPFDNVVAVQADRARIADPEVYRRTLTPNGRSPGFVLVDGRLAGIWSVPDGERVVVDYLTEVTQANGRDVDGEVTRLEALLNA
ncbi:winged helix DNA-binding domain-containing protein [Gordonia sp. TBRC 11910]|uniref:Winged helix DNA-binding domain-containing protein n=1 Tax=Gordonia asplenii TaxID=2725283 RepID=A0A848L094_9ACTN|nr:winged helix DNA-binding domain-containing protein [Gordonia asplenii]NMO04380.1 winged helix DNA-binding domain-containing protein [Gordonia asplenii]